MDTIIELFGGDKSKVNIPVMLGSNFNDVAYTPLYWLLFMNTSYKDLKKFIKDYNPDVNIRDKYDFSAIKLLCQSNKVKLMKLLIRNGANVNEYNTESISGDRPPLHFACRGSLNRQTLQNEKHMKMIKTLIDHGADLNQLDKDNKKPLEYLKLHEKAQIGIFDNIIEIDDNDSNYILY